MEVSPRPSEMTEVQPPRGTRSLRRLVLATILVLLAAFTVAIFRVPREYYAALVTSQISAAAARAGLHVVVTEPDVSLVQLHARKAEVYIPRLLSTLQLQDITLNTNLPSLLTGRVRLDANAKIWGGAIRASGTYKLWNGMLEGNFELEKIALSSVIQLQAFGVESGTLSASLQDATLNPQTLSTSPWTMTAGNWSLRIHEMTKSQDTFIQLPRGVGAGFLAIPSFQQLTASSTGILSPGSITCSTLTVESSLGGLSATGKVSLATNGPTITLSGDATLSEGSIAKFGSFLPLLSGGSLSSSDKEMLFEITGALRAPELKLQRKH